MIAVLVCAFLPALQAPGELQAGFGAADITPELGASIPGGWKPVPGRGVLDPLLVVACVVSDGTTPVALVGVDGIFIGKQTVRQARERIAKNTRIPGANVLVAASHTHTGGPLLLCHGVEADPAYQDRVAIAVAKAVEDAWAALQPCEIGVGLGKEDSISFNRRFLMKDGKEITHPGKPGTPHHREIVRPAGPIDPDVGVLAVRKPGGAVTGVVVTFACHGTAAGGDLFSADYIGPLRKRLKAVYGDAAHVVFLNGACGDITQVDNLSPGNDFGPGRSDLMGAKLAAEAVRTIGRMSWMKTLSTAAATETVPVRIRSEPDVAAERPAFGLGSGPEDVYAVERKRVADERAKTPVVDCEVQGLRIGPLGIATNGAEYFVDYGLRIKQASPHKFTWFVELANEYIGYVPTAEAFVAGGYETRTAQTSKLAPDGGQKLLEGALRALNRVESK
jgi:neutral ceramidase